MFSTIARKFASLKSRRGRHAIPRSARQPLHAVVLGPLAPLDEDLMGQRPPVPAASDDTQVLPQVGHSEPPPLASTLLIHHIGDQPRPVAPFPPSLTAVTAVHNAVEAAKSADPGNWYGCQGDVDWPDVPADPPTLAGAFHFPEDRTPCTGHAVQRGHAEVLKDAAMPESATVPVASPNDAWFRAELTDKRRDDSMTAFHRRTSAWLQNGTAPAPRNDVGLPLDTRIFATVSQPEFTPVRNDRSEASS